jgi:hypothetical protein
MLLIISPEKLSTPLIRKADLADDEMEAIADYMSLYPSGLNLHQIEYEASKRAK